MVTSVDYPQYLKFLLSCSMKKKPPSSCSATVSPLPFDSTPNQYISPLNLEKTGSRLHPRSQTCVSSTKTKHTSAILTEPSATHPKPAIRHIIILLLIAPQKTPEAGQARRRERDTRHYGRTPQRKEPDRPSRDRGGERPAGHRLGEQQRDGPAPHHLIGGAVAEILSVALKIKT